jgi:protein farnesyltransferase subunit beta
MYVCLFICIYMQTYTALAIARLLNILTPELTAGVGKYLLDCQTYEGGFGGEI